MFAAEGDGRAIISARLDQGIEREAVQQRQVAGKDQPCRVWTGGMGSEQPGSGPDRGMRIDDTGPCTAKGVIHLLGTYGHETPRRTQGEESESADELRTPVIGQRRFVLPHAAACPPGEHKTVKRDCHGTPTMPLSSSLRSASPFVVMSSPDIVHFDFPGLRPVSGLSERRGPVTLPAFLTVSVGSLMPDPGERLAECRVVVSGIAIT